MDAKLDLNTLMQETLLSLEQARAAEHRFEILKAMNTLAHATNDEGFMTNHWLYIIPDEADDEELLDIAVNDEDIFNDAVACFLDHWDEYALNGGLYIGNKVYPLADDSKGSSINQDS